jgi:hypothetical protein
MMKRTVYALGLVALWWSPVLAADRLTDKDVKSLVGRIEEGRDRFDDALDGDFKSKVLRGPAGEVSIANFLNDFQESIDRIEERLKPEYAASAEVATMLRQASAIDGYFRQNPSGTRAESEWNRLASDLKALATAYGADFPLAENATVRRIGDRELATAVQQIAKTADQMKKSLDTDLKKDASVDKAAHEALVAEADQLSKDAKALRDRVKDGHPSSAEATQLMARATKMQAFVASRQLPTTAGIWSGATGHLQSVASAYGTAWSTTR